MRPVAALPSLVIKEVRALVWPTAACAAAMGVPTALGDDIQTALFAYLVGVPALGALSMGHEYSGRTLSLLLSQPVSRERLYVAKLTGLALMLTALVALGYAIFLAGWNQTRLVHLLGRDQARLRLLWVLLPPLGSLCVTPWLTMAGRSAMAGTVFTLAIPALLQMTLGAAWQAVGRPAAWDPFTTRFMWLTMAALCAVGALAGWRRFIRLEVLDGPGGSAVSLLPRAGTLTARAAAAPASMRHPAWLLITKELHLQQLAMALASLYVLGWLAATWLAPAGFRGVVAGLSVLYAGLMGLVIGSFASAEERQLGTVEWHVLLPVAMSTQWLIKMGVVFGLTVTLAVGLPAALEMVASRWRDAGPLFVAPSSLVQPAWIVLVLTTGSVYVSSLCRSGIWAMMMSLFTAFGTLTLALELFLRVAMQVSEGLRRVPGLTAWWRVPAGAYGGLGLLLTAGFIALTLRFAMINHRSADRPRRRAAAQVLVMMAYALAWAVLMGVAAAMRRPLG